MLVYRSLQKFLARLRNEEAQPLAYLRESKLMVKCFLNYCKHHGDEVDVLFQMLSIFTVRTTIDYSFLKDFYLQNVAEVYCPSPQFAPGLGMEGTDADPIIYNQEYTARQKNAIMHHFVTFFLDPAYGTDHKVKVLQILIIPMLNASFVKKETTEVVDSNLVASIVNHILDPTSPKGSFPLGSGSTPTGSATTGGASLVGASVPSSSSQPSGSGSTPLASTTSPASPQELKLKGSARIVYDEALSIELLQLATLLVQYVLSDFTIRTQGYLI